MKVDWGNTIEGDKLNLNNLVETSKSRVEEPTARGRGVPDPLTTNNDGTDTQEGGTDILVSKEAAVIPNVDNIVDSVDEEYENMSNVDRKCGNIRENENICDNICQKEKGPELNIEKLKKECNIVKRICTEHGKKALLKKEKKRIWTKVKKTGLFGYRTVSSINWICPEAPTLMPNLTHPVGNLNKEFFEPDIQDKGD